MHLEFGNTSGHWRSLLMASEGPQIPRVSLESCDKEEYSIGGHPGRSAGILHRYMLWVNPSGQLSTTQSLTHFSPLNRMQGKGKEE